MRKSLQIPVALLIVVVAVMLARVMIANRPQLEDREQAIGLPLVTTVLVQKGRVELSIRSQARVTPKVQLQLGSEVSGRVLQVADEFVVGSIVAAGAPLLRIDDTAYQLAVDQARLAVADAELALAEEYARIGVRRDTPAAAQAERENQRVIRALAQIRASKSQLAKAEQDLRRTRIHSPIDAVVNRKQVEVGQFIAAGSVVGELHGIGAAELRLPILLSQLSMIDNVIGKPVSIFASASDRATRWAARVTRVEQQVDIQTHVAHVVAEVLDPYGKQHTQPLRLGRYVTAEISGVYVDDAVRIPREALFEGDSVFVVDTDSRLQRRQVAVLWLADRTAVIGRGVDNGDAIVTNRLDLMVDGMRIATEPAG